MSGRRCWCGRPALPGELDCAEHDNPPPTFRLFGVPVPAEAARTAGDGTTVFEPDGQPVTRWRTDAAKPPRRPAGDGDIREYLRQKGEIL